MNHKDSYIASLSYLDKIQLDGAHAICHINYGKSPVFNGEESTEFAKNSRKKENSVTCKDKVDDLFEVLGFNDTEMNYSADDRLFLWRMYWLEYCNAYFNMCEILPNSITTVFIGRQAVEIGFKYLLIKAGRNNITSHDLGELAKAVFDNENKELEDYLVDIEGYCRDYCQKIEGSHAEFFRFPEYRRKEFFAGNRLDVSWLSYNFALILKKMLHFAGLDNEVTFLRKE